MSQKLSREFLYRLRCGPLKQFEVARKANLHPSTLSRLVNDPATLLPDDDRIRAVGRILKLEPWECYEPENS